MYRNVCHITYSLSSLIDIIVIVLIPITIVRCSILTTDSLEFSRKRYIGCLVPSLI